MKKRRGKATQMTSREFNQQTARAKRAAAEGPVVVTDRGRPSYVLMSYDAYRKLAEQSGSLIDVLGRPHGVADVTFSPPRSRERSKPATLD
ncbi:MAG: type II toxin-antitoxin system Phd/YefM family antitoxin [Myxococcales bacterium]|nr:type II toxin-antitoxin system Phd/YefM family antitoxin [Myxococcales bacterium]MCB9578983.1 type II toxin-antitoxin system Phd/YefM family antitoxin [Polyangiaceae bacterium]